MRCAEDIPAGAFVCAYVGELITEAMVDELEEGKDLYLFCLDHFMHIFQVNHKCATHHYLCPRHKQYNNYL